MAFPDELDMERYAFASQALRAQELERRSREEKERWGKSFLQLKSSTVFNSGFVEILGYCDHIYTILWMRSEKY